MEQGENMKCPTDTTKKRCPIGYFLYDITRSTYLEGEVIRCMRNNGHKGKCHSHDKIDSNCFEWGYREQNKKVKA